MESQKKKFTKQEILRHFLKAGINISPNVLDLLFEKSLDTHNIEELIREISYIPDFKLHLTNDILAQTDFFQRKSKDTPSINSSENKDVEPISSSSPPNEMKNDINEAIEIADEISPPTNEQSENSTTQSQIKENTTQQYVRSTGMYQFKPIAKEYSEQIEVIKDPTTNLYTSGSIQDFELLFRDRFKRLSEILHKNPEVKNVEPINQVKKHQSSGPVNIIGMVKEKRSAPAGKAVKFSLDDRTGEIDVIVRPDMYNRNSEAYDNLKYLLNDEVVFVSGHLKVNLQSRRATLFGNKIIWPDIPKGHRTKIPSCPVSFAMLSDLHIGSDNFLEKPFTRFLKYLKGELYDTQKDLIEAGRIKYVIVCGDLVDGVGIYPDQINELEINDIFQQYEKAAELFAQIPDYVKIIYIPGNHEPVRKAIPHPAVPSKYCQPILDLGVTSLGDPSLVELHGIKFLLYHGDGMIGFNTRIYGLPNDQPAQTMREMLRCRHLSPMYGEECTELATSSQDWLVVDQIPHVFHTGHLHINDYKKYRNVTMVNSGCFQAQTKFMKSLGITPTPGKVPIISETYGSLETSLLNLTK